MTEQDRQRVDAEISKLIAETGRLNAETAKLQRETQWYPAVVASGATLAIVAIAKLFL